MLARCSSRCHALASCFESGTFARAAAKSAPVLDFSASGLNLATGLPFLSRMYVMF